MKLRHAVLPLAAAVLAACTTMTPSRPYVVATLEPTRGNQASGTVWFVQDGPQVLVRGRVTGLKPNQEHGFHVHEKGDCSSGDGMSAGGHLNPDAKPHGPPTGPHHAGDLPALKADANGVAVVSFATTGTIVGGAPGDIGGKALIVHASPDDYTTQPTGNSGARIACGLISKVVGQDASGKAVPPPPDL